MIIRNYTIAAKPKNKSRCIKSLAKECFLSKQGIFSEGTEMSTLKEGRLDVNTMLLGYTPYSCAWNQETQKLPWLFLYL